ncbi:MAG TPA: SIMPL domain-containing protein [Burkholderiales bacterium]|nr:SIMPL domain-containing protein [Burkholderiales bacterium]
MKPIAIIALCAIALVAHAQTEPAPLRAGVVTLDAQASAEVPQDIATVTLAIEIDDADPAQLVQKVNSTLDETMKEAKGEPKVTARSGGYRTYAVSDRNGRVTAWRARAEVILESRDFKALAVLAGRLSARMPVGGITFSLSPEARRAQEDRLLAQAIAAFQSRAEAAAKAFGYARYSLLEVAVHTQSPGPVPRMLARNMAAAASPAPVPVEGGQATVTVSVSGSVKLER